MENTDVIIILFSALVGGVVSGGGILALFYGALKDKLRETFASKVDVDTIRETLRGDINGLGMRVTSAETVARAANDVAGAAHTKALEVSNSTEREFRFINEKLAEAVGRFNATADRMDDLMERVTYIEARQGAVRE